MLKVVLAVLIIYLDQKCVLTIKAKIECGYKQCPQTRDGALNVHLIPHSHMDAGWVKTFDEYYYGTKTTVSTANVQLIYHSVLSELLHDKRRKFTFSETAFFWRWWKEQRPATRATFRALVQEGRIEFAGGGWVQNDEATLDYLQIIDLFTWGLRKINDTLGPCGKPKAAWQIDTYGHTREQTSLLAQMGYDGLFIGRVDHKEREAMIEEDRMEFMWRGSDVLGKMSDIMTHTLFNLYNAPDGFCFDFLCSDEPIVDDPDNRVYNAEKRVNDFIAQIERQAKYYDHDNIMVTMGGDFTYQSAANWFMNMDKLINHVNTHPANISDVNIFYSTPSCYLKAIYLYGRRDKAIYTEKSDHIPYSSDASTYWTGYYTSRPSLKYFVRRTHIFLQVVKQLTVIARMGDSYELHLLRHAVNLVMHHDAITGTSQQHVANDFIRTLSEAIESCTKKVSNLLTYLTPTWGSSRRSKNSQQFIVCHQLNMSQCRFTETQDTMLLLVYNPLSVKTYHHVRLPANSLHYSIRDYNDEEVEYQLVPLPAAVINLPGRSSTAIQELCFEAENIPPLGYSAYYVAPVRDPLEENEFAKRSASQAGGKNTEPEQEVIPNIANEYIKVAVNKETGLLESIQHVDGVKIDLSQNFHFYSQTQQGQQSGAYSFRPEKSRPTPVTERVSYHVIRGTLVKEIRQRFTDWISQVIRLYRGEEFVELEWIIGPVPVGTDLGKEVVSMFKTNVTNSGHFYTDSNSRQMTKRTCWNESATQQQKKIISGCYYPVTSRICVQSVNTSVGMCVLTDRTQGGTSYNEGEIELMVHRRLLTDDGFGLEESLNEEAFGVGLVVKGKHRILFGNLRQEVDDLSFDERVAQGARRWLLEPWLFMTSGDKLNRRKWQNVRNKRYSALRLHGLPRHIHVLTLEPWKGGSVLLRLENTLEKPTRGRFRSEKLDSAQDFAAKQSHITVQLRQLFLQLKIRAVRETTLAANQWLDDARQMDWSTRYVYNGADDDILPEDNMEYKEEPKPVKEVEKETVPYSSDEGQDYKRTQRMRENTRRIPYRERDRRKRSANSTENINENIINGTFEKQTVEKIGNASDDVNHNFIAATKQLELNMGTIVVEDAPTTANYKHTAKPKSTNTFSFLKDMKPVTKPSPKLSFLSSKHFAKPSTFFIDLETSEAETEEDFSDNLKKRSPRGRHRNGSRNAKKFRAQASQPPAEDCDDGITKSIFEMYYKTKTKPRKSLYPYHGSSEEFREEPRRRRRKKTKTRRFKSNDDYGSAEVRKEDNIQDSEETTRRTDKSRHNYEDRVGSEERNSRNRKKGHLVGADMPFFVTGEAKRYRLRKRDKEASMEERDMRRDGDRNRDREEFAEERREREFTKAEAANRQSHRRREEAAYSQEYEPTPLDLDEEEKELANEERQVGEGRERIKRAPPRLEPPPEPTSEQAEQGDAEPEFTITLRPTQIRTFVIWFEIAKNPYTS